MMKKYFVFGAALLAGSLILSGDSTNAATPVHADIQVDANCEGSACGTSTIANSNTTRKLAVSSNGTIFALFRDENGIWVSRSSNNGASFSSAKKVTATNAEAEIGTSANGSVYVIWAQSGNYVISMSADSGETWGSPITVGQSSGQQAHMAIDGDYVYAVGQQGTVLYYSSNSGQTWNTTNIGSSQVFADVHVDPITHNVYVFTDNPSVYWYVSTDRGATLSARKVTGKSVFFSVGALTSTGNDKYFYMAGAQQNLERINLSDESVETKTVSASAGSTTRSLAADACGNVVSGHKSGSDLYFQYSTDSGATFSSEEMVVSSADRANASINTTNGDVMFLYEKAGDIFLSTYSGLLSGSSNCYAATLSRTAIEFTAPGQTPSITLTNTSNSPLSVDSISITGSAFVLSHNCGTSIPPGSSCSVSISGSAEANETLSISIGGITRTVPVALGAAAAARPPETTTTTTTTTTTEPTTTSTTVQETTTTQVVVSPEVISAETSAPEVPQVTTTVIQQIEEAPVFEAKIKKTRESLPETGTELKKSILLTFFLLLLGLAILHRVKDSQFRD